MRSGSSLLGHACARCTASCSRWGRHSSAHLLAEALEALYPGVKFGIGPPIENGFYYDIDLGPNKLSADDFGNLEAKMLELAKRENTYNRQEIAKADAIAYFKEKGDEYKLELLHLLELKRGFKFWA